LRDRHVCGAPLGKLWRVSQPYAPGATEYWTTYTYDGSGRTLTTTAPDGSVTSYQYTGATTKVTDPAGKWKQFTNDAMGNLVTVTEPNPAGGSNLVISYVYNFANQLRRVTMPRNEGTQTRTFQWSGSDLVSATNPENGTVTYQYDGAHHVTLRTDAKGQQTVYTYDAYGRLTKKQYWAWGSTYGGTQVLQEQADQEVDYFYDTNPIDANYSAQAWGRMTAVKFANGYSYQYSYSQPGRVIKRKLRLPDQVNSQPVELESQYAWDNEGRMTSQSYPAQDAQTAGPQYGYQFDAMGRTSSMTGPPYNLTIATAAFGPAGELTSLNGDTRTYNILGQLTRITGGGIDLEYVYTAGQNNGRITQQIDHVSGEQVTYQYL
jgi:YD repeat-containing protein